MSTQNNRKKPKSKAAREKLGNRPFSTVAEYNVFKEDIQKSVIKQLEFARAMEEYTSLPEYEFFKKKFEQGMHCAYGESGEDIVHVFMDEDGIQISINEEINARHANEKDLVGILVKAMSESLVGSYFKALGYLPNDREVQDEISKFLNKKKKS